MKYITINIKSVTTPLPKSFDNNELGLMTKKQFLQYQNEENKHHPSTAYDFDLASLNKDFKVYYLGESVDRTGRYTIYNTSKKNSYIIKKDDKIVAVYLKGILYYNNYTKLKQIPDRYISGRSTYIDIDIKTGKLVKYLTDYIRQVSDIVKKNYTENPVLINRIKGSDGDFYEIRAESEPKKNKGVNLVVLNEKGEVVAIAQNEWGATLIAVADEYRKLGLGKQLYKVWNNFNPKFRSGGFTNRGENLAVSLWEDRVREFLDRGWYSELVKKKLLTKKEVDAIIKDLPNRKQFKKKLQKHTKTQPLFLIDDNSFIIYDKSFYDIEDYYKYDDSVESVIYAYGMFRSQPDLGSFLYAIDYEPKFREIAHYTALQMAKNNNELLYDSGGKNYSDLLDLRGLKNIKKDGSYISLVKDVMNLKQLSNMEKSYRKKYDKYDELYNLLIETADSKWR